MADRLMNRELVLTVLYDLALTIGSEVDSVRLLDKTLRRLLYHTGFPSGVVVQTAAENLETSAVHLSNTHGNYQLAKQRGCRLDLAPQLMGGKVELIESVEWLSPLSQGQSYTYCLKLPVDRTTTLLLLSPCTPASSLPLERLFQPVLANLAKALSLCRDSENLRQSIEKERDHAQQERDIVLNTIRHERAFLSTLYQTLPDLVWLKDPAGVYLSCNALFGRFFNAPIKDIIGKTDYDFVSKELGDFFRKNDLAAAAAGKPTANEETLTFGDKSYHGRFHTVKTPMFSAEGQFIGILGVARDITENHQLLETLRQQEVELKNHQSLLEQRVAERTNELAHANAHLQQTQFAMGAAGIAVHWVNADNGRFLFVNQQAGQMLGYSVEEMLTMQVPDIDSSFPAGHFKEATLPLRKQKVAHFDTQNKHRAGQLIPVTVTLYFVPSNSKDPAHFICFVVDITARREAEKTLRQAKEMAEEATRAKSAFLANMSHEIRTPMNAIIGIANLMQRAGVSPKQAEQLEKIDHASQHLLEIINNILDLSKIEAGKIVLDREKFTLAHLLRSITAVVSGMASQKGLSFRVQVAGLPSDYCGDATRLRQALLNFVGNAIKFTEQGNVTLSGQLLEESATDYLLRFEVSDTGPGMNIEQQAHLFKAFEQGDGSITRKYGGTGLGLVISKHIAELMGGEAGVISQPGSGSTFWLSVRLEKIHGHGLPSQTAGMSAEAQLRADWHGHKILLAEDDLINREVALGLLLDVGLLIDVAEDGRAAVDLVKTQDYDLILMDMQMPRLDGLGATLEIRRLPERRPMPIIAMTANAFAEDRQRCLEAGMNDFLTKPVNPETLFATLLKWLEQRQPQEP